MIPLNSGVYFICIDLPYQMAHEKNPAKNKVQPTTRPLNFPVDHSLSGVDVSHFDVGRRTFLMPPVAAAGFEKAFAAVEAHNFCVILLLLLRNIIDVLA